MYLSILVVIDGWLAGWLARMDGEDGKSLEENSLVLVLFLPFFSFFFSIN